MAEYPEFMSDDLEEVLGWPSFKCAPLAHAWRAQGVTIACKAEAEQAFVLHWLIGLVLQHGSGWREIATETIKGLHSPLIRKSDGADQASRTTTRPTSPVSSKGRE